MLLQAARRLVTLLGGTSLATAVVGVVVGLLAGISIDRAVSVAFYSLGSFLLVAGFFVGNRGPTRPKNPDEGFSFVPFSGSRQVRWASLEEQQQTISLSAIFVVVGVVLVLIGLVVDSRQSLI